LPTFESEHYLGVVFKPLVSHVAGFCIY
jgi:hypothetical protein